MADFLRTGETVKSIIGENGWLEFNPLNLAREEKSVEVYLMQDNGTEEGLMERRCLLGADLSKRFRSKRVTAGMLLGLEVGIADVNSSDVFYIVEKAVARVRVKGEKLVEKELVTEEIKWQDFIAL